VYAFNLSFFLFNLFKPLGSHKLGIKTLNLVFRCARLCLFLCHEQLKIFFSVFKLVFLLLFHCLLFFYCKVIDALFNALETYKLVHCRSFDRFNEILVVLENNLSLSIRWWVHFDKLDNLHRNLLVLAEINKFAYDVFIGQSDACRRI